MRPLHLLFLVTSIATATAQGQRGRTQGPPVALGTALPDITVVDGEGKEFPLLQKLKGKHSVITFGCLT